MLSTTRNKDVNKDVSGEKMEKMIGEIIYFEDEEGKILSDEEINEMSLWEIEERKIHVYESAY